MLDAAVSLWCRALAAGERCRCQSQVFDVRRATWQLRHRTGKHGTWSMAARSKSSRGLEALCYLVVAGLAAGVYWNSVDGQFVHDDIVAIVKNDDVIAPAVPLVDMLRHDFWGEPISSLRSHKSYRPLCVATFRLVRYLKC